MLLKEVTNGRNLLLNAFEGSKIIQQADFRAVNVQQWKRRSFNRTSERGPLRKNRVCWRQEKRLPFVASDCPKPPLLTTVIPHAKRTCMPLQQQKRASRLNTPSSWTTSSAARFAGAQKPCAKSCGLCTSTQAIKLLIQACLPHVVLPVSACADWKEIWPMLLDASSPVDGFCSRAIPLGNSPLLTYQSQLFLLPPWKSQDAAAVISSTGGVIQANGVVCWGSKGPMQPKTHALHATLKMVVGSRTWSVIGCLVVCYWWFFSQVSTIARAQIFRLIKMTILEKRVRNDICLRWSSHFMTLAPPRKWLIAEIEDEKLAINGIGRS